MVEKGTLISSFFNKLNLINLQSLEDATFNVSTIFEGILNAAMQFLLCLVLAPIQQIILSQLFLCKRDCVTSDCQIVTFWVFSFEKSDHSRFSSFSGKFLLSANKLMSHFAFPTFNMFSIFGNSRISTTKFST